METDTFENISFYKHGTGEYYRIKRVTTGTGIHYEGSDPIDVSNKTIIILDRIIKENEIKKKDFKRFTDAIDLARRTKVDLNTIYDKWMCQYKITSQKLKKILSYWRMSNYNQNYNLRNILIHPEYFITEAESLLSFDECERIEYGEKLKIPFEVLCEKWTYDAIRKSNLGYVQIKKFWEQFNNYIRKKGKDLVKYKKIVEAVCILSDDKKHITTKYYDNLEKTMGDNLFDISDIKIKKIPIDKINKLINKFQDKKHLIFNTEQRNAILHGINENFSVIIGYPGTGKTTIVECIIWIYKKLELDEPYLVSEDGMSITDNEISDEESDFDKNYFTSVAVMAPTGKAYVNIYRKLSCLGLDPQTSGTIHKEIHSTFNYITQTIEILNCFIKKAKNETNLDEKFISKYMLSAIKNEFRSFNNSSDECDYRTLKDFTKNLHDNSKETLKNKTEFLEKKITLMVVDESSMIDNYLFSELLIWVKYFKCRLILLGDDNQLPSVQAGCILEKIVNKSEYLTVTRLTEIKRQDNCDGALINTIKNMAERKLVNLSDFSDETIVFEDITAYVKNDGSINKEKIASDIIEKHNLTPENSKMLSYFKDTKYSFNTKELNLILQEKYCGSESLKINKPESVHYNVDCTYIVGDNIVRTENDYTEGEFRANGEEAKIVGFNDNKNIVHIRYENSETITMISVEELYREFSLSYCTTVHKSQGSQCENVVFFLQSNWLDIKIPFTAISRAVKKCIVVTTPEIFRDVQRKEPKQIISFFMERFNVREF